MVDRDLLDRLATGLAEIERLDEPTRSHVLAFLDDFEALHRTALSGFEQLIGSDEVSRLRRADSALAWLLDAYGVGVDERAEAETALESVRPYIHSHGGHIEVLDVRDGVVRVRLSGSCSGCTASAETLTRGVEQALRESFASFAGLEVEPDDAPAHPPPGPTLIQVEDRLG